MTLRLHDALPVENRIYQNPGLSGRYRLFDPARGVYLHLSGAGTTRTATWSWIGTAAQAERLKARAEAQGDAWPFLLAHPVTGDIEEHAA